MDAQAREKKRKRERIWAREFRKRRKVQGICNQCNIPVVPSRSQCTYHLAKSAEKSRRRRQRLKEEKRCPICGKPLDDSPYMRCFQCLERHRVFTLAYNRRKRYEGNYEVVMERDCSRCRICHSEKSLVVHHIDGVGFTDPNAVNNDLANLIVLCRGCHASLTRFLNRDRDTSTVISLLQQDYPGDS